MIGTLVNVAGIIAGGVLGLVRPRGLSAANESFFKVVLGALAVFFGLRLTWASLNGPFLAILKQLTVVILALMLGRVTGRLLRLQQFSNRIGKSAGERIASAQPDHPKRMAEGFKTWGARVLAAPGGVI
jgi:uncharacterized membrane protein YqgA involved in biofilm formation